MINKHFEVELTPKLHWIQIISNSAVQRINSCNALHFGFHNISKLVCFSAGFQIDSGSVEHGETLHTPGGTVNGEWKENNRRDLMNYVSNLETFA
jgi:hypothetical protein